MARLALRHLRRSGRAMIFRRCVPAYIWAGNAARWAEVVAGVGRGDLVVVTGPASGPPTTPEEIAALAPRIEQLRGRAATIVGYVALGYGARPTPMARGDVVAWQTLGVDGVWFDEAEAQDRPGLLMRLRSLHGVVRSWRPHPSTRLRKGVSCWNPGTWHPDINALMRILPGSLWCTIECAAADYDTRALALRSTTPTREIHLVHSCSSAAEVAAIGARMRCHAGYGYATTDGADGNPWD